MPNTFSPPSWREDQPWAIEQGLANSLGARSPNLAETMLTRYGIERQGNQAAYHDYMRAINALQQQNMQFNQDELKSKNAIEIGKLAGTHSGGAAFAQGNPYLHDAAQGDMSGLESGAAALQAAKEIHDRGLGFGGMAAGGVTPTSDQIGAIIPQAAGMQMKPPTLVQAAQINADSRRDAAAIGAEGRDQPTVHSSTPATATTQGVGVSGKQRRGETLQQTNERLLQGQAVRTPGQHAMSQMVDNANPPPQLPLAQTDGGPMDRTPNGSTPAGPRGTGPTADQATTTVTKKLSQWLSSGDPVHKKIVYEASEYSHEQGQGGKFIVRTDGGRLYVLGRGGQAYLVQ